MMRIQGYHETKAVSMLTSIVSVSRRSPDRRFRARATPAERMRGRIFLAPEASQIVVVITGL